MNALRTIIELDKELLLCLNDYRSLYFDYVFWLITNKLMWIPLYVSILYVIFKRQRLNGLITLLLLVLVIVLCDQISTVIFKHGFERLRPSHDSSLQGMVNLVAGYKGGKFGFVSSHATNSFGLAIFTSLLFNVKLYSITIFAWAVLNSYSRIYLGVHFPADIVGGAILGLLIGTSIFYLYSRYINWSFPYSDDGNNFSWKTTNNYIRRDTYPIIAVLSFIVVNILLSAKILISLSEK